MKKSTKAWSMKMRLALLGLAALVWIAVPVSARAEGETVDTWDGKTIADGFAAGDGTQDNPFQIETAAQLAYFAKAVNEGNWYDGEYIILKNNIDLNNQEWTPIGIYRNSFRGNFDGRNNTVTGMLISNSSADYVGLFGECTRHNINSAIKNITVKDSTIQGKSFVGAIVGSAVEINIENCRSIANKIKGERRVGGICGYFCGYSHGGKVSQCYNSSKVTGRKSAGGIAGMGDRCTAENCLNTGEITVTTTGTQSACGGIFGTFNDTNTTLPATITACVNLGKVSGGESFGGIVGSTDSGSTGHISNCYYNMDAITGGFDAGTALTAGQLCGALPDGLDSAIWEVGSVDISTAKATQGRFGKATGTYINLQSVAAIEKVTTDSAEVYNFATTGNDAEWDTYTLITTAKEFAAIGQDTTKWSANYVLGNDIDVSGVQLSSIGDPGTPYTGKFSGDGHTIGHVNMAGNCLGLFGGIGNINGQIAESGKVMLLAANGVIASNIEAGGICGYLLNGEIYGCSFTGTVKGARAGGISGNVGQYTKISQCFFAGDVQGKDSAAGICGYSPFEVIDHCISIAAVTSDKDCAGIVNSGDYGTTNCYFNNDICNVKDEYNLGCSTLKLTSSSFFEELKTNGFNTELWTKKANDKENGIAYYPSLGENNAVGVNYTTGLSFEGADTNIPTYGENITFKVKALVNFVTNGQTIFAEDTEGGFEIRIGDTPVVSAAQIQNGTATYKAQTVGETTFTLVYTGTNSSFFPEQTTKNLTVNINPAPLTVVGEGIARGTYGNKLSELTVTGLTAKLGTEIIDGTWRIDGDKVPYVGDSKTYTATFIPKYPEYYQSLTAPVKLMIQPASAWNLEDLELQYSWAAKGEKAVQIPGLPEDLGKTVMTVITREDSENILAADSEAEYSEGKLIFTLGENAVEDIGKTATLLVELQSQNYENFHVCVHILRTAKADREDTPDPDAFDMTFTVSGNDLAAEITTDRTDVEFSFDGTDFGQTKTTKAGHDEKVTARIRYEESDDYNASPAISKTWNSGHGTLTHHDRVEPTCQAEGSIEYWTCDVCGLYFASADGSKSITAAETVLPKTEHSWSEDYQSDMTGHWHKCSSCGATTNPERHVSGGPATTQQAEICTVCGYEIAPKRPADNNTNGGQDNNNGNNNSNSNTVSGNNAGGNSNSNTGSPDNASDNDDNDDPSDNNSHATPTPTPAPVTSTATPKPAPKPTATPAVTVAPTTTPAPAPTEESTGGDSAAATEETVVMEDQTQNADTPETGAASSEALEETSAKGMTPGRVAAAAAVVVGGGGAAVYVTMIKGKFKFK